MSDFEPTPALHAALISMILNFTTEPRGVVDLDGLALLVADDCLPHRRLVRELLLGRIGLGGADDVVLDGLLRVDVAEADDGADRDHALRDVLGVDHAGVREALLELGDLLLDHRLLVLRVVVLRVLRDVTELARGANALGDLAPPLGAQSVQLLLQGLVALRV